MYLYSFLPGLVTWRECLVADTVNHAWDLPRALPVDHQKLQPGLFLIMVFYPLDAWLPGIEFELTTRPLGGASLIEAVRLHLTPRERL